MNQTTVRCRVTHDRRGTEGTRGEGWVGLGGGKGGGGISRRGEELRCTVGRNWYNILTRITYIT